MSVVPRGIETDAQPPMAVPLRHFVVALGFLVAGSAAAVVAGGRSGALASLHLLLAGWVCVTIMGAMTQFVPVWSGVRLHSRRLAAVQLWLVAGGLVAFAAALTAGRYDLLAYAGAAMLAGFWTFAYNLGRTLVRARPFDVTERHFALALAYLLALTALGLALAVGFTRPVFGGVAATRAGAVGAHAALAVFGVVLTTVFGALYQLATMFTRTDLDGLDERLQSVEEVGYPVGVVALATGRLAGDPLVARIGGLLVAAGVVAVAAILARRLAATAVDRTPMLSRYAVAATAMVLWAVLAARAWLADPLAAAARFGAPGVGRPLALAAVGFVVLGTLYHVVPFIVWEHRYGDLLGYERIPMIDDLYSDRLASVDFVAFVGGTGALVAAGAGAPATVGSAGRVLIALGSTVFAANLLGVLYVHGPRSVRAVLLGARRSGEENGDPGGRPE